MPAMLQQTQRLSAATSAPMIYVSNVYLRGRKDNSLLGFASDADGNVAPLVRISGRRAAISSGMSAAIDKNGRLYMTGNNICDVGVWPAGSNGDVGDAAQFYVRCDNFPAPPVNFVLDDRDHVWAAAYQGAYGYGGADPRSSIVEYQPVPAGAAGDIKLRAIRTIGGTKTGMHKIAAIALSGRGLVSVQRPNGTVLTFAATANGNVAPLSVLGGDKTQLAGHWVGPLWFGGIKYDSQGRLVACSGKAKPRILTFAPGAHGNVAPISTLFVPGCFGIALDRYDNIYVSFYNSISVYAAGSTGSAKPIRTIKGKLTTLHTAANITF